MKQEVHPHIVRRLAVECHRDPRTIRNALEGRGGPMVREQVIEAIRRLGLNIIIAPVGHAPLAISSTPRPAA